MKKNGIRIVLGVAGFSAFVSCPVLAADSADMAAVRAKAEAGDARSQFELGHDYYHGYGVPKDYAQARKWEHLSAAQNYAMAQYKLGRGYYYGFADVNKDEAEGIKWWRKAADQGLPSAQFELGRAYYMGRGVKKDNVQALLWCSLAASPTREGLALVADKRFDISHTGEAKALVSQIVQDMTPEQIAEAKQLAKNWKPQHPDKAK